MPLFILKQHNGLCFTLSGLDKTESLCSLPKTAIQNEKTNGLVTTESRVLAALKF